ncbi:MAG: sigma 54-interacting transcriptional regulator [Acidobacteriota bacterium]
MIQSLHQPFAIAMSNALRYQELARMRDLLIEDNRALSADIQRALGFEVVGADFGLRQVMEMVRQVAPSSSPALLLGETGTGKEVIANAIHAASPRSASPMISMQCGAIPETLLDSELFGHEKGAFTGAAERKRGRFERADGGTLFLDEIGELSPAAQVKLLRVLQEQCFERVGGTQTLRVDVRVIAATHRDLDKMVREGAFREDLWYRLNVLPIRIPPLRLRRQDVPSLVQYFVERKAREMSLPWVPRVANRDLERLSRYGWPGNVRELQNLVERALILSRGEQLSFPPLDSQEAASGDSSETPFVAPTLTLDEVMAAHIRAVLDRVDWQVAGAGGAAELLGMNPSTLRFRIKKLGITKASV